MTTKHFPALLMLLLPLDALACETVDANASKLTFTAAQDGVPVRAAFKDFGGEICREGSAVTRIAGWLDVASVSAGMPELEQAVRSPELLHAAEFPRATFTSTRIERQGEAYIAHGTLELHGVKNALTLPFRLREADGIVHADGEFTLDRLEFGIGAKEWPDEDFLARDVKVAFSFRLE